MDSVSSQDNDPFCGSRLGSARPFSSQDDIDIKSILKHNIRISGNPCAEVVVPRLITPELRLIKTEGAVNPNGLDWDDSHFKIDILIKAVKKVKSECTYRDYASVYFTIPSDDDMEIYHIKINGMNIVVASGKASLGSLAHSLHGDPIRWDRLHEEINNLILEDKLDKIQEDCEYAEQFAKYFKLSDGAEMRTIYATTHCGTNAIIAFGTASLPALSQILLEHEHYLDNVWHYRKVAAEGWRESLRTISPTPVTQRPRIIDSEQIDDEISMAREEYGVFPYDQIQEAGSFRNWERQEAEFRKMLEKPFNEIDNELANDPAFHLPVSSYLRSILSGRPRGHGGSTTLVGSGSAPSLSENSTEDVVEPDAGFVESNETSNFDLNQISALNSAHEIAGTSVVKAGGAEHEVAQAAPDLDDSQNRIDMAPLEDDDRSGHEDIPEHPSLNAPASLNGVNSQEQSAIYNQPESAFEDSSGADTCCGNGREAREELTPGTTPPDEESNLTSQDFHGLECGIDYQGAEEADSEIVVAFKVEEISSIIKEIDTVNLDDLLADTSDDDMPLHLYQEKAKERVEGSIKRLALFAEYEAQKLKETDFNGLEIWKSAKVEPINKLDPNETLGEFDESLASGRAPGSETEDEGFHTEERVISYVENEVDMTGVFTGTYYPFTPRTPTKLRGPRPRRSPGFSSPRDSNFSFPIEIPDKNKDYTLWNTIEERQNAISNQLAQQGRDSPRRGFERSRNHGTLAKATFFTYGLKYQPDVEDQNTHRTVKILVPVGITLADVLDQVRFGKIEKSLMANTTKIAQGFNTVLIHYFEQQAAETFVNHCLQKSLIFNNQAAMVTLIETPTWPVHPRMVEANERKSSRIIEVILSDFSDHAHQASWNKIEESILLNVLRKRTEPIGTNMHIMFEFSGVAIASTVMETLFRGLHESTLSSGADLSYLADPCARHPGESSDLEISNQEVIIDGDDNEQRPSPKKRVSFNDRVLVHTIERSLFEKRVHFSQDTKPARSLESSRHNPYAEKARNPPIPFKYVDGPASAAATLSVEPVVVVKPYEQPKFKGVPWADMEDDEDWNTTTESSNPEKHADGSVSAQIQEDAGDVKDIPAVEETKIPSIAEAAEAARNRILQAFMGKKSEEN